MKNDYPLPLLCAVMAVSRSGYHAWAGGRRSVRERRDAALRPKLRAAFAASRDGVCNTGEFCYYYNSGEAGSISDFTGSIAESR